MLRRGIRACEPFAAEVIEGAGWRSLIPDLTRAAAAENADFRVQVILALKRLGSADDFTNEFISALKAGSSDGRIRAAMGARLFPLDRMRASLLDRVRRDPSWFVRVHAAESLIELADIYPRDLYEHRAIATALSDPNGAQPSLLDTFGLRGLTPDDLARLATAADLLDRAITDRQAEGPCAKKRPLTNVALYVIPLSRTVVALAVETSIGSCERDLAFVTFVQSPGGFGRSLSMGTSGKDVLKTSVETSPKPVTVEYRRATKSLVVGSLVLDTTKANVMVLASNAKGVAVRHQAVQNLVFQRRAQPSMFGADLLRFRPEIVAAVRAVLDRSPELRDLTVDPP